MTPVAATAVKKPTPRWWSTRSRTTLRGYRASLRSVSTQRSGYATALTANSARASEGIPRRCAATETMPVAITIAKYAGWSLSTAALPPSPVMARSTLVAPGLVPDHDLVRTPEIRDRRHERVDEAREAEDGEEDEGPHDVELGRELQVRNALDIRLEAEERPEVRNDRLRVPRAPPPQSEGDPQSRPDLEEEEDVDEDVHSAGVGAQARAGRPPEDQPDQSEERQERRGERRCLEDEQPHGNGAWMYRSIETIRNRIIAM